MKLTNYLILSFLLVGCVTTPENQQPLDKPHPPERSSSSIDVNEGRLTNINEGMTLSEVKALMGQEIVVGYNSDDPNKPLAPVLVRNPYKVELVSAGGHDYTIYYYVFTIKKSDGVITDDELMPVIFENDVVVGQGWKNVLIIKANAADES